MVETILSLLQTGLVLWNSKEKNKYQDELLDLKKRYYEEYNKPDSERSDDVLSRISLELRLLCDSFTTKVGASGISDK